MRKLVFLILSTLFLVSCNFVDNSKINKNFKKLKDHQSENVHAFHIKTEIYNLERMVQSAEDHINALPKLEGQLNNNVENNLLFLDNNEEKIKKYIKGIEHQMYEIVQLIKRSGQKANEEKNKKAQSVYEAINLFALSYIQNMSNKALDTIMPLTIGVYEENFEENQRLLAFREDILKLYMGINGLVIVANKDIQTTMLKLNHLKKKGKVDKAVLDSLPGLVGHIKEKIDAKTNEFNKVKSHLHESDHHESFMEFQKEFLTQYHDVTFLYDFNQKDNIPLKIITWIGNLTWGSFNSLVGAGWVLGAAIVSPFTNLVDFPTITLSRSGTQLYADVSGTSYFSGKISLGIFELDHNAGWTFASYHEGGHALQSAVLGPFYLPVVFTSYIINGGHGGFVEDWADVWGDWIAS